MTTDKQIAANKANAQKSTGAKSPKGKAIVASNSIKHGIYSSKVVIHGESLEDFQLLLGGLVESLKPVGTLEQFYVERIAHSMWRQFRLVKAESAYIELQRTKKRSENIHSAENALGYQFGMLGYQNSTIDFDFNEDDKSQLDFGNIILEKYSTLNLRKLHSGDVAELKKCPELYEAYMLEADISPASSEVLDSESIAKWLDSYLDYCVNLQGQLKIKLACKTVMQLVQTEKLCPYTNELLARYQVALDNELSRAIEGLRSQQIYRKTHKVG
ncbi:MAG TPA: hypothetical protein PL131_09555 [Methylotenera sp.]|nr:hypothetical protein [Methylotenera sp.]HPH06108.1 hypothetical protein [Methylotenera sp.]